jgi:hypothetical protein
MSITIDYFFNFPKPIDQTAEAINTWIGCNLGPYQDDPGDLYSRFLGMEFTLWEHTLENDGELDYESYKYAIGIRTPIPEAEFRMLQLPTMAFLVFALHRKLGITGMLAYDVQVLLGRYEEKEHPENHAQELFDSVSNKFVSFPSHLEDLWKRMPSDESLLNWEKGLGKYLREQGRNVEELKPRDSKKE